MAGKNRGEGLKRLTPHQSHRGRTLSTQALPYAACFGASEPPSLEVSGHPSQVPTNRSTSNAWTPIFFTCALIAIGQAVQVNRGAFDPVAISWLALAALTCLAGGLNLPLPRFGGTPESLLVFVASLGFAYQVSQLVTTMPGTVDHLPPELMGSYLQAVAFAAVAGGPGSPSDLGSGGFTPCCS